MAVGRYTRVDNRRSSSSHWSTVTIVVFVALCLVGIWMMTSSSIVPVQNADVPQETKNEIKEQSEVKNQVSDFSNGNPQQFEDSQGNLPDDTAKGDSNVAFKSTSNVPEKQEEKFPEDTKIGDGDSKTEKFPEDTKVGDGDSKTEKYPEDTKIGDGDSKTEKFPEYTKTGGGDSKTEVRDSNAENNKSNSGATENNKGTEETVNKGEFEENSVEKKSDSVDGEKKDDSSDNKKSDLYESGNKSDNPSQITDSRIEEKVDQRNNNESDESTSEKKTDDNAKSQSSNELYPSGAQSELLNESTTQTGSWSTQAAESKNEKESQNLSNQPAEYNWKLCNVTAGSDYIPCLDNWQAVRKLRSTKHYQHRERHCPAESPTCLVPLPEGYRPSIEWPKSRERIWYHNVPHTSLAQYKGHQNWVKLSGEYLTFPGGGTQFQRGAPHYIDFIQQAVPEIGWGKRTRVVLDVGCGVASFGGFLFERDVLTMSFAPKDEHEAQVQFALERGIPAVSAVMGTQRLPFPGSVFDAIHCARCRVPWHIEGGRLLLELNRLLRPGGFFIWSATPVYQKHAEDIEIWDAMKKLTEGMCWEVSIIKDRVNKVGIAIFKKPKSNECYEKRSETQPEMCPDSDDPNAAWNIPLQSCMHKVPENSSVRGYEWPPRWPARLSKPPYWLLSSDVGVYGKPAPEDFTADYENWKKIVSGSYLRGIGINWSKVRNVMDMRCVYGGFAAALRDLNIWVMNVVGIDSADTLPLIYERGLFGVYHDWCESFSTYPRTYDLLHANNLFSKLKKSCNFTGVIAEVDRMLRPGGKLVVRDKSEMIKELEVIVKSLHWEVLVTYSKDNDGFLSAQKSTWRPTEVETLDFALATPRDFLRDNIDKVKP